MIFFAPAWIMTCLFWGAISQIPAVKATRDKDEQEYDKAMIDKAKEGLE